MDDKKKIVLASKDVVVKKTEDVYINVNLKSSFNSIKKERFDNNFDLAEQFRRERNASRNFRVYGIIDSTVIDCDNLSFKVYSKSTIELGVQVLSNQIASFVSQKIGFGDKNVFGKMKGKYLLELNNYVDSDVIYIEIPGDGVNFDREVKELRLVFTGADGEFIEYGTSTIDIGINGIFETINNDFPFFYNKHWIKNNFQIKQVKVRNVSFGKTIYSIDEGDSGTVTVELNEPSVFGTEKIDVELISSQVPSYNEAALDYDFTADSHPSGFPISFSWGPGEKIKEIKFSALSDYIIEKNLETFSLKLTNPSSVTTDNGMVNIDTTTVSVVDKTIRSYINYNFQNIVKNIFPLVNPEIFTENLSVSSGYSMNNYGAKDGEGDDDVVNSNYRFFPNDKFKLTIKNEGTDTILPVIPGYTGGDRLFKSGESLTFDVITKYQNHDSLPREKAVLDFRDQMSQFLPHKLATGFYINGLEFEGTFSYFSGPLAAINFVNKIKSKYAQMDVEIPFEITINHNQVTLTSKHPADNINVFIPKIVTQNEPDVYGLLGDSEVPYYPEGRVSSITSQIPFVLKLNANYSNASSCRYSFKVEKNGYEDLYIPAETLPSSPSGKDMFLITPIKDVVGPLTSSCDVNNYSLDSVGYYANGIILISKDENLSSVATSSNQHSSGFKPSFKESPLSNGLNSCGNIDVSKFLS